MKRMISEGYQSKTYPDVWSAVTNFSDVIKDLELESKYMEDRTESDRDVIRYFKTPEQAEAYIEALETLTEELKEILMRFKQISGIED